MLANHSQEVIRFDLQAFADDDFDDNDFTEEKPAEDEEKPKDSEPEEEPSKEEEPKETEDEEFDEIDFNHQTVKVPKSKRKDLLQKGYHYDEVRAERDKAREFAKSLGYKSFEELEQAYQQQQLEADAKDYATKNNISEEAAQRLLANEKKLKELEARDAAREYRQTVDKQKSALKDKPFFKDLEGEIDALVEDCIQRGQPVDVETIYKYVRGEKLEELLSNTKKQTVKSTVADIHDRAKRGGLIASDAQGEEGELPEVDTKMANAFGVDPKEIAKYVKQQLKRR